MSIPCSAADRRRERGRAGWAGRRHRDAGSVRPDPAGRAEAAGSAVTRRVRMGQPGRGELLQRVAEATTQRFPQATVTERPEAGYLRVSHPLPGGGAEQQPVGAIEGHATQEALDAFVAGVYATFAVADPSGAPELVYGVRRRRASLWRRRCGAACGCAA